MPVQPEQLGRAVDKLVHAPLPSPEEIDAFLAAAARGRGIGGWRALAPRLVALLKRTSAPAAPRTRDALKSELRAALGELQRTARHGALGAAQMPALRGALVRLERLLRLFTPEILSLLPREVRSRLEEQLLEPLEALVELAGRAVAAYEAQVVARLVRAETAFTVRLVPLDVTALAEQPFATLNGADRYRAGDWVCVPTNAAPPAPAFVAGVVSDVAPPNLVVHILERGGNNAGSPSPTLRVLSLPGPVLVATNPLKLGDYVETRGGKVAINGLSAQLGLVAVLGERDGAVALAGHPAAPPSARGALVVLQAELQEAIDAQRAAAAASPAKGPHTAAETLTHVAAGGAETVEPLQVRGEGITGALFTSRGTGGAYPHNEDAAVVGAHGGAFFLAAADEAGGYEKGPETGAMSRIVAEEFHKAAQLVATRGLAPAAALRVAVEEAHARILSQPVFGPVAFAGVIVVGQKAYVASLGDSAALLVRAGHVVARTTLHNAADALQRQTGDPNAGLDKANIMTRAVGQASCPPPDLHVWDLVPGDRIVTLTDGFLDAGLLAQQADVQRNKPWAESHTAVTEREIGEFVAAAADPVAAVRALVHFAHAMVALRRGKGDNLGISVAFVDPPSAATAEAAGRRPLGTR